MDLRHIVHLVRSFAADRRGTTTLEYALIAAFSVMLTITAFVSLGGGISGKLRQVAVGLNPPNPPAIEAPSPAGLATGKNLSLGASACNPTCSVFSATTAAKPSQ